MTNFFDETDEFSFENMRLEHDNPARKGIKE